MSTTYHGISNESLVISPYTHEPSGECVGQENKSDEWDIPWLYHEKGLYINYFIPSHRKNSGQMGRLGLTQLNCTD